MYDLFFSSSVTSGKFVFHCCQPSQPPHTPGLTTPQQRVGTLCSCPDALMTECPYHAPTMFTALPIKHFLTMHKDLVR